MARSKKRRPRNAIHRYARSWRWRFLAGAVVIVIAAIVIAMPLIGVQLPQMLISIISPQDRAASTWQAVVTDDAVNVRAEASTGSDVIGSTVAQQRVTVTGGPVGDFLPVVIDGKQGWMAAAYLRRDSAPFVSVAYAAPASDSAPTGDGALAVVSEPTAVPEVPTPTIPADVPAVVPPTEAAPMPVDEAGPTEPETLVAEPTLAPNLDPPAAEVAVANVPSDVAEGERWIDVNRTTANITLYIGDQAQSSFTGRIGRDPSTDGFYSTAVGTFHVYSMQRGLSGTPFVEDVYLSDWVGFDPVRKNGFHSPVREADGSERVTQNPTTMGCVRLTAGDAVLLFDFAEIGMRVEIHD